MKFIVCRSDWQEFIDAQKRQAAALERVAGAVEKSLDDSAKIKSLTEALREHTERLAAVVPR